MKKNILVVVILIVIAIVSVAAYLLSTPRPTQIPTPTPSPAASKLKIAVIYVSPLEGETWNLALHNALTKVIQKYGLEPYKYTESVAPPDAERIARAYIDQGFKLIFFHSWFPDAIKMIGKEHPDVVALGAGGGVELNVLYPPPTLVPPNIGHYDTYMHESGYLAGALAGKMTKTNKIGIVGGFPVANSNRYFNGFIEGIKSVNENAQIKITWIYSWSDPPKAKEAAKALIEWGADFIGSDRLPGPEAATEETRNAYIIHFNGNLPTLAPNTMIAGVPWILDSTVDEIVSSVMQGKFVSKEYVYGLAAGGTDFIINLPDKIPSDIRSYIQSLKERIMEGKLVILPNNNPPENVWGLT